MIVNRFSFRVWQDPVYFVAFGFGTGLLPIAPGTWGTLAALPLYLLINNYSLPIYLFIIFLFFILGIYVSGKVVKDLGVDDYGGIVWDEVVGYLLTMAGAPIGFFWMLSGFILFRLFDIWKPFPISFIEKRIKGGLGVMLDDILAAVPACLILKGLAWTFSL
ncbi:phosphatidylglycerophosphatase A [Legionella busanensis]|uniref:Phosphatidylglycerophosphatase A n=1 Tax=Legionella busanensis TaxID=190655 RepID=A0A378JM68_9GAMM|nr:phosphatidylglycerophosphatase A [Legionella busanensis]STX52177.1 phosphatidylglycerophosphatase A [Legionella busanensis]